MTLSGVFCIIFCAPTTLILCIVYIYSVVFTLVVSQAGWAMWAQLGALGGGGEGGAALLSLQHCYNMGAGGRGDVVLLL